MVKNLWLQCCRMERRVCSACIGSGNKHNCVKLEASPNSIFYQTEFREILFSGLRKEWKKLAFLKSLGGKKKGTPTPTKEANPSTSYASIWCMFMVLWYSNLEPRNLWLWRIFLQWGLYEFHGRESAAQDEPSVEITQNHTK